jgi:hypothetical protein
MQCDGPDAVEARETAAWLSRVGGRDNREMCRRGWTTCDNGDLCLGGLDKDCCCCYPDGYVPYVHRQAGWDVVLAVVYDDVCGKQAIECWMQASAQKQEVKRGTTQQTRLGERVR